MPPSSQGTVLEPSPHPSQAPDAGQVREHVRRKRSVNPTTALSEKDREQKDLKVFFKMVLAAIVVAGIAFAVYYFLKQAS
ncbi:MAG: hypothetical protein H7A51_03910 [Akkermansiaceae bacterium]|nr:hypothetical protein [Akkermansiaceae bacterium]